MRKIPFYGNTKIVDLPAWQLCETLAAMSTTFDMGQSGRIKRDSIIKQIVALGFNPKATRKQIYKLLGRGKP